MNLAQHTIGQPLISIYYENGKPFLHYTCKVNISGQTGILTIPKISLGLNSIYIDVEQCFEYTEGIITGVIEERKMSVLPTDEGKELWILEMEEDVNDFHNR